MAATAALATLFLQASRAPGVNAEYVILNGVGLCQGTAACPSLRVTFPSAKAGMSKGLTLSWHVSATDQTLRVRLVDASVDAGQTILATTFTLRNPAQRLVFDWKFTTTGANFTVNIGRPAVVTLPATGGLFWPD